MDRRARRRTGGISILLLVLLLITIVHGQNPTIIIDNFKFESPAIVIVITSSTSFPVVLTNFVDTTSTNIIGGERDLQLTTSAGAVGMVSSTGVSQGEFSLSCPPSSTSFAILQYDGLDGSMDLNTTGLQSVPGSSPPGIDFLQGNGTFFNITYFSDQPTNGYIYVYDIISAVCFIQVDFPSNSQFATFLIPINSFIGDCDFHLVGAVEFFFNGANNIDFLLSELSIVPPPSTPPPSTTTLMIDDFTIGQAVLIIVASSTTVYPVTVDGFQQDASQTHILGGERDMEVAFTSSVTGRVTSASVSDGSFDYASPSSSNGFAVLQYDGDDESMNVNVTGLTSVPGASSGLNLENNNGKAFNLTYSSDIPTSVTILLFDIHGGECTGTAQLEGNPGERIELLIPFDNFSGNCNIQKVGAIEIDIDANGNVDCQLFSFSVSSSAAPI